MKLIFTGLIITMSMVFYTSCINHKADNKMAESLYNKTCATCHGDNGLSRSPGLLHLRAMTPKSILSSLETGKMQSQGEKLSESQKIALVEYITQQDYSTKRYPLDFCNDGLQINDIKYSGWGGNLRGTGFIQESVAQLPKESISNLKLKWAFGFEGGSITRTKPTVIGNYIIFGSQFGKIYCLNMDNGCIRWMFEADANVRGGVVASDDFGGETRVYFADFGGNTYSLNANTGDLIWKVNVKNDPNNAVTGTPAYYKSVLYIPLSSMEAITAGDNSYECCKSSGQIVAVNAESGKELWRHRVTEYATEHGVSAIGIKRFGPSGSPVWSSPTVDTKRGLLYFGTGQNYSNPPTSNSDAIQALDLITGELKWNYQGTRKDIYIAACSNPNSANCPELSGPDLDFGMAPMLTSRKDGREVLVVGQKSGVVHCLDPETGQPLWQKRIGRGGALGGIHWGMATDGNLAYAANSDWLPLGGDSTFAANPGLFALDLMTGNIAWKATSDPMICKGKTGCYNSYSAAPTLIPGAVFTGSLDGYARSYDTANGDLLWEFNTNQSFETINGVAGHGGSIDGPGPVVANGMVFINSGYAVFGQMPENVLLAFSTE